MILSQLRIRRVANGKKIGLPSDFNGSPIVACPPLRSDKTLGKFGGTRRPFFACVRTGNFTAQLSRYGNRQRHAFLQI